MDSEHEAQDELVEIGGRQYRVHPAAAMFPIMSGREFDELVEDVRVNGLREPVVVRGDQLVDGRNRVRACVAAGVAPEVRELEHGTDVASWVMSVNVHRRHLDASQRALLASRLSALSGEVTLIQAGELMGVSRASVARAAAVEKGPEPLRAVARDGLVSVGDAYELRGEEPETIEQLVGDVRSGAAPNLRAAKRQRGIADKPRKKDPRGRKPKAAATDAGQTSGEAGDGGGGVALGQLVDPEEPGPGRPPTAPGSEAETLFSGAEALEAGEGNVASNPGDLRSRAEVALGGHAAVEGSSIDEGAPWPAEGGVVWLTGEDGLDGVVERVVDCVKKVSESGGVVVAGPADVGSAATQRLMALPELTAVSFERASGGELPRMLWGFRVGLGDFRRACDGFGVVLETASR